ncbi:MAG: HEAT repeat domain-containing protein [Pseudomonadota bacterium]
MDQPGTLLVPAICRYLTDHDAVMRSAAAQALSAVQDTGASPALATALLDEDPDVRADAMAALALCATEDQRAAIAASLVGDPVPEVKVSAVQALTRLGGVDVVELLTRLAADRLEDEVTWDDTDSVWDDWLDVQSACVAGLGALQAAGAIPVLLAIRQDEFGQDLDAPVFSALSAMGGPGVAQLLVFVKDPADRVRQRALKALGSAEPAMLAEMAGTLIRDANPDVRQIGVRALPSDSPDVETLMLGDTAPFVRKAALLTHGPVRPDLIARVLGDPVEEVVAAAVDLMAQDKLPSDHTDLAENLAHWIHAASATLAEPALTLLAKLDATKAADLAASLAQDDDRPLTTRIAAIGLLPMGAPTDDTVTLLADLVKHRDRQIRLAALAALSAMVQTVPTSVGDEAALELARVIAGKLSLTPAANGPQPEATDLAASKEDPDPKGRIVIDRDGEIVASPEDDTVIPVDFPRSTLDALQSREQTVPGPEANASEGRRRRVSVTGPDDYADDLRVAALTVIGIDHSDALDTAVAHALASTAHPIQIAALRAIKRRGGSLASNTLPAVQALLGHGDTGLRLAAAEVLQTLPEGTPMLAARLDDPDPSVRACAVRAAAGEASEAVLAALEDRSAFVRQSAVSALLVSGVLERRRAVEVLLRNRHETTLIQLCQEDEASASIVADTITSGLDDRASVLTALKSVAQMGG